VSIPRGGGVRGVFVMVGQIAILPVVKSCCIEFHYDPSEYEESEEFNQVYL
jgi:hypothetical protein